MLFEGQIHDFLQLLPWVQKKRQKRSLRSVIEQRRRMYDSTKAKEDSEAIIARIEGMSHFREAKTVMIYYPIKNEVDLRGLVHKYKDQKTFLLPVTHRRYIEPRIYEGEDKLRKGHHHNIPEPQTHHFDGDIDLILAPGVVFDKGRNRIGRGGGYYDKFLRQHREAFQIGVCYDFQLRKQEIPHFFYDHRMNRVVTPTRTIE